MNSVEKVLHILKERRIPVSRLERDLHFSNGYIKQLKKGSIPAGRLMQIAAYLEVPFKTLLPDGVTDNEKAATREDDGKDLEDLIRLYRSAPAWLQDQARSLLEAGAQSVGNRPDSDSKA